MKKGAIYEENYTKGLIIDIMICICSLVGLVLNFNLFKNLTGVLYYTIFSNLLCFVHIFTPLLVLADCIINGKNKMLKYSYIINWTIVILLYGILIIVYQNLGGMFLNNSKFPYFNFDYEQFGLLGCICINVIIIVVYDLISFITIFINRNIIRNNGGCWK